MRKLLFLTLVLASASAFAQLQPGDVPTSTNNVQLVLGTNQSAQLKLLWNEDFAAKFAAWQAATNATPGWATTNAAPVKPTLAVWGATVFKEAAAGTLAGLIEQRNFRAAQTAAAKTQEVADTYSEFTAAERAQLDAAITRIKAAR